jgi:hypothetical protein
MSIKHGTNRYYPRSEPTDPDAGPWEESLGVVYLDDGSWDVAIGDTTMVGAERLRVVGSARVEGQVLAISFRAQDTTGGTGAFMDFDAGDTVPVSAAGDARLRYNSAAGDLELSENGGAFVPILTGAGVSGWTDAGTNVHLTTTTDNVSIGVIGMSGGEKLRVVGDTLLEGKLTVTGSIDPTDIRIEDAGNAAYLELDDGQNAAVSAANEGRLRYNEVTQRFEVSENTGAYAALSTGTVPTVVVADLTALAAVADASISEGSPIEVATLDSWWLLKKTAGLTPDGITVIQAASGAPAVWVRQPGGSLRWALQTTWYINSAGDDENVGSATGAGALATMGEFLRRIKGVAIPQNTTLNIETAISETGLFWDYILAEGAILSIYCTRTTVTSSTFTGMVRPAPTAVGTLADAAKVFTAWDNKSYIETDVNPPLNQFHIVWPMRSNANDTTWAFAWEDDFGVSYESLPTRPNVGSAYTVYTPLNYDAGAGNSTEIRVSGDGYVDIRDMTFERVLYVDTQGLRGWSGDSQVMVEFHRCLFKEQLVQTKGVTYLYVCAISGGLSLNAGVMHLGGVDAGMSGAGSNAEWRVAVGAQLFTDAQRNLYLREATIQVEGTWTKKSSEHTFVQPGAEIHVWGKLGNIQGSFRGNFGSNEGLYCYQGSDVRWQPNSANFASTAMWEATNGASDAVWIGNTGNTLSKAAIGRGVHDLSYGVVLASGLRGSPVFS